MFDIKPVWHNLLKNHTTLLTVLSFMLMLFLILISQPFTWWRLWDAIGDNLIHFNFELEKELTGRDLKDREFTFKLLDVTDGANPVELGETTNDAKSKIVFQISHLASQASIIIAWLKFQEMMKMWYMIS